MSDLDESFILELRVQFCHDGIELISSIESALLSIEKSPTKEKVEALKRDLHCLKGNARAVGFENISKVVHEIESLCVDSGAGLKIEKLLKIFDSMGETLKTFLTTKDPTRPLAFRA